MKRNIVFGRDHTELIKNNLDIFKHEFKSIPEKDWKEFKSNPQCGSCVSKILSHIKKDPDRTNKIFSFILKEDVIVYFPEAIESPMVREFDSIVEMEEFLKDLKDTGKIIRNVNPSPNGRGGYIMVVM